MPQAKEYTGIGVGQTAAVGPCVHFAAPPTAPADEPVPAGDEAIASARAALAEALKQVSVDLQAAAAEHSGETLGDVLSATAEMADDPALADRAGQIVAEGNGPANAITKAIAEFAAMFTEIGGYMAERVTDLNSVRDRTVARLLDLDVPGLQGIDEPAVVIAHELTPADTSGLDMSKVIALVTEVGGPTSHTAIIARQLGLPCVVRAAGATQIREGSLVAVDSATGSVVVDPDEATREAIARRMERYRALASDTAPGATSDGHRVQLLANIGGVEDARAAAGKAVEGVGLFRTEFVFLDAVEEPSIAEQTEIYREVLNAFAGRKVVVRTLDAGADKPLAYANPVDESNPALGQRAYRLVRSVPHLMEHQLKALAAAIDDCPGTEVWVMAPMISTAGEAADFRRRSDEAGLGAKARIGVMVEVPAVALCAEQVFQHVDFVSIGTNDLAQYTMATDRELGTLSDLIDRWQPAVLKLVEATARAGAASGTPVGVCGESASDPLMALVLCGLGVTSLSMSVPAVPAVRFALRHTSLATCQAMARAALSAPDPAAAVSAVQELLDPQVREAMSLD
ncbi:phosphoenolpyruvate--protein phosphotransferase [Propionibacterium australiense]|uniref:Phosphoenolpyruvate-protein phosphotransferase n=1 Tax=Propionibacterium australiense TaxID=119981 RepID=A0A383S6Y2_9ACTN|nr:phosphoenolpyruvate--protein phosphotransferase [Propionibacterium australiense]RLP10122.1 phosphoenolpyruvate--protein phosphotransferase [Propionibacterium australiense]RLP11373.1 phosphoenolpyruvate--protein phosphotransferase [Propionibacterium australiense]SYZ33016.1 phosphoenolpyruvate-protein phosphotransferase [Propionibacterium australiense]VEH92237.1 Phosphoenolpyruvate-protein phosphotransferase [Propionibacterium australiense]